MKHVTRCCTVTFALLAAIGTSLGAYAEEESIASDESGKVTIDTDTVQPSGAYVLAGFWAYSGDSRVAILAMIEGCDQGRGRIEYKANPDNAATPTKVGLWKSDGEQITDKMARAACEHAKGA